MTGDEGDDVSTGREAALLEAFIRLADTLVTDFDMLDLLHRLTTDCVDLLPTDAVGLLLADRQGAVRVVATSSEQARLVELFQLQSDEGPCLDCFRSGHPVSAPDLVAVGRWPRFTAGATEQGFRSVHALPMRLRGETIGALNLFSVDLGPMPAADLRVAQALADAATISILQERTVAERHALTEQLQAAHRRRAVIEQAKGVLAERGRIEMGEAFARLRSRATETRERVSDLARRIVTQEIDTDFLDRPGS